MKSKNNSIFFISILTISFLKILCTKNKETHNNITKNNRIQVNFTSYFINSTLRTLTDKNFDTII